MQTEQVRAILGGLASISHQILVNQIMLAQTLKKEPSASEKLRDLCQSIVDHDKKVMELLGGDITKMIMMLL